MLQQAEGNVLNQKSLLEHAKTEFARFTKLFEQKAAADTDVENWRNQRDTAQAGLMSAEAQRDLAKLNLTYTWVVAPFTGRIDRRLVDPGNLVGSGIKYCFGRIDPNRPALCLFQHCRNRYSALHAGCKNCFAQVLQIRREGRKIPCLLESGQRRRISARRVS